MPNLTKDIQTEQLLCWNGMTDTEHISTTSSSEEEEEDIRAKKDKHLSLNTGRDEEQFTILRFAPTL